MKYLRIILLGLVTAGIADAQNRAPYYGAVDLGSKGARAALYTFEDENGQEVPNLIFSRNVNSTLVSSMQNGRFTPEGIADAAQLVKSLVDLMQKEALDRGLSVNYYIVASSGVERSQNRQDLDREVKAQTGLNMEYITSEEEGYYGLLSAVPPSRRLNSIYVDVGSGNTKMGCLLKDVAFASYRSGEIPYGSVSGRNEALKRDPQDVRTGVKSLVEGLGILYQAQTADVSCLRNPKYIYWSGGAAWATATFVHPEAAMRGSVTITRRDIDSFIAALEDGTWNQHPLEFTLPEGMSPKQKFEIRQRARQDREDVQNVFVREDLLAGVSILREVLNASNSSAAPTFVRTGNYIYGYALAKFPEHASLNVFSTRNAGLPKYVVYRLSAAQTQTLNADAARLQTRATTLKKLPSSAKLLGSVSDAVSVSLKELNQAEADFLAHKSEGAPHPNPAIEDTAKVFFEDLRLNYQAFLKLSEASLAKATLPSKVHATAISFERNSASTNQNSLLLANRGLEAIEENGLAFAAAADSGSLTFDLKVKSTPEGAAIQYKRRGENFRKNPEGTNAVIAALPLAIWFVHIHADGYEDQEIEHDPFRQNEHRIDAVLKRASK